MKDNSLEEYKSCTKYLNRFNTHSVLFYFKQSAWLKKESEK